MRTLALFVALVAAVPALAEPPAAKKADATKATKKKTDAISVPAIVGEAQRATAPAITRDGVLGIDGKLSAGVVITPPDHPDKKMVVEPPDPNDPMALELGTNQLTNRVPRTPWLPRDLSLGLKHGADKLWDVVLPKL